jgi:hypothetical protein
MSKSVPNRYRKLTISQLKQRIKMLRRVIRQNNEMIRSLRNDLNTIYPVIKNIYQEIEARDRRPQRKTKKDSPARQRETSPERPRP